jgi:hypothetical protein
LAGYLQDADVSVIFDRWHNTPGTDIVRFIERIADADFICAVGTPAYRRRDQTQDTDPVVQAELGLIKSRIMKTEAVRRTLIPLLREGTPYAAFSPLLRTSAYVDFRTDAEFFVRLFDLILAIHRIPFEDRVTRQYRDALQFAAEHKGPGTMDARPGATGGKRREEPSPAEVSSPQVRGGSIRQMVAPDERTQSDAVDPSGKRLVRYFVSFSRDDEQLKDDLLKRLRRFFRLARNYQFDEWQDNQIDLGSDWNRAIQTAINECEFGLLLVSPAFLGNDYITKQELPHFVGERLARKRAAPVALKQIFFDNFDSYIDLKGLAQRQIFRDKQLRAYDQLSDDMTRDEFARQLFKKIADMLDKSYQDSKNRPE